MEGGNSEPLLDNDNDDDDPDDDDDGGGGGGSSCGGTSFVSSPSSIGNGGRSGANLGGAIGVVVGKDCLGEDCLGLLGGIGGFSK